VRITENQKHYLKPYVQNKPVFVFDHQSQIEVISSFPYLAATGNTMEEAKEAAIRNLKKLINTCM